MRRSSSSTKPGTTRVPSRNPAPQTSASRPSMIAEVSRILSSPRSRPATGKSRPEIADRSASRPSATAAPTYAPSAAASPTTAACPRSIRRAATRPRTSPAPRPVSPPATPQNRRSIGSDAASTSSRAATPPASAPTATPAATGAPSTRAAAPPAAAETTSTSSRTTFLVRTVDPPSAEERLDRAVDCGNTADLEGKLRAGTNAALRHDAAPEAERGRFLQPDVEPRHRAHLAREPDLAQHDDVARHRPVEVARRGGQDDAEIRRRLRHAAAARDVDEHVLARERHADTLLEHREQKADPVVVGAEHRPPRRAEGRARDERLVLEQQRARALTSSSWTWKAASAVSVQRSRPSAAIPS